MKTAHTPGPWQSNQYGYIHAHVGYPRSFGEPVSETMVAVVASEEDAKTGCCLAAPMPEREANAHLIAAAPELFEALKLVLIFHDSGPWTSEKAQEWSNGLTRLMGPAIERRDLPSNEATTKNLCNAVRAAISKATEANP